MSGVSPILGGLWGIGGGSSPFSGRDIVWVDLRFPAGVGVGTEELPFSTANIGVGSVPSGGTLVMVGGDASTEPGVTIGSKSFAAIGYGGQKASGGLTPVLPTLTYAITTGTQRLAFRNISVALVHSGTVASLSEFYFEFCPTVTLTAGGDASPVFWVGAPGNIFSGSGGAAQFVGGTIAGYVANGGGTVAAAGSLITSDITSSSSITLTAGCTFGGALSITAPTINVDITTLYNATIAGVTFSSTVHLLVPMGTPSDIGTANSTGAATTMLPSDHVHRITFTPLNAALATANAAININGQKITGSGAPTAGTDLVTKTYADAIAVGLKVKTPAVAVATANQATMSGTAQTIDGVALNTIGQRVLLTAQTTATQNGLWVIAAGAWTRPTDFLTGSGAAQSYVLVTGGTTNGGSSYFCTNATGSDVVDTANLTWVLFSQAAIVTAGAGLTKTGNTLDVAAGDATIVVHADDIVVGVIGNANLADNTIALARLVSAGGQNHFLMRKSASGGAWEDGTASDAKTALGIFGNPSALTVRAATTANITLSGTQTVDGVALIAGDRCLVKNQTTGANNGLYLVASGAWTRTTDAASAGQIFGGLTVHISEGTANGNQVAMLTTDDPITIGSTALTFAMGRVAALGAVAPLDVTDGAAQIGTSQLGTPIDHVHHLAVATVIALLATSASAISVNSQKITGLATPTVGTDATNKTYVDAAIASAVGATVAPANPGDNGKIAYANAGALAYATNIKTDGTRYQFGVTGTGGLLNFAQSSNIAFGANNAGTQVVPLMRWGSPSPVALVDGLYIGSTSGDAGKVAAMRFGVDTAGAFQWEVNGTAAALLSSSGFSVTQSGVTTGTAPVAFTVSPASHTGLTGGDARLASFIPGTYTYVAGAYTSSRMVRFRAQTLAGASATAAFSGITATVAIEAAPIQGTNATLANSLALWIEGDAVGFGSTPARSGVGRFSGNTALKWRNLSGTPNTFDVQGIAVDGSDNVVVGDNTNGPAAYLDCKTGGTVNVRSGASVYAFSGTTLSMNSQVIAFGATPSTNALINATNNSTILGGKTAGGNNSVILSWSTANDITIGDNSTNTNDIYLAPNGAVHVYLGAAEKFRFNPTYLDFMSAQARFGASPSTIAALNFSNNTTVASGKDSGGTDRNLLVWTSGNILQVGSGNITSVQLQSTPGNAWTFGATAAFAGVEHNFAASAFLSFTGTHAGSALFRGPANAAFVAGTDGSGHDLTLVSTDSSNNAIFGMSTFVGTGGATIVQGTDGGSGGVTLKAVGAGPVTGTVVISATGAAFNLSGVSNLTLASSNGALTVGTSIQILAVTDTILGVRNAMDWGVVAANHLRLGAGLSNMRFASTNLGFYSATPVAKPSVSGSRGTGGAALANLLTALASTGLLTDSTTP